MSQTLFTYQQNLNESQKRLVEIGQRVTPYTTNFQWKDETYKISTTFNDDQNNILDVYFHIVNAELKVYEVEFNINKHSAQQFRTTLSHFFKIISTVVECIEQFIEKYKPLGIEIEPEVIDGKVDQRTKIYLEYLKVNIKNKNYIIGKTPDGFNIQLRNNRKRK